jgi:hypothetical protein
MPARLVPWASRAFAVFLLSTTCLTSIADDKSKADDESKVSTPNGKVTSAQSKESSDSAPVLEERESLALKFVEAHDAALASLLQVLKAMKPKEYDTAINEITKVRKRLEQLQSRDKPLYEVDLEGWKLQSKIDMMMARAVAKEQTLDEKALRELVKKRHENQVNRLRIEQDNLKTREKQIHESLERLQKNESERLDQQLSALIKKVDAKKPKSKRNDK